MEENLKQKDAQETPEKKLGAIICSWCGKEYGTKETFDGSPSHGLCPDCERESEEDPEAFDKKSRENNKRIREVK